MLCLCLLLASSTVSAQVQSDCSYEKNEIDLISGDTLLLTKTFLSPGNAIHLRGTNSIISVGWGGMWFEEKPIDIMGVHRLLLVLDDTTRIQLKHLGSIKSKVVLAEGARPSYTTIDTSYPANLATIELLGTTPVKAVRIETDQGSIDIVPDEKYRTAIRESALCFMLAYWSKRAGK
jgi:hypothetical protein